MLALRFFVSFALIALGVRSYIRLARRAREAGKLAPGPADTNANAVSVYGFAFSSAGRSADTWLMAIGFGGGLAVALVNFLLV